MMQMQFSEMGLNAILLKNIEAQSIVEPTSIQSEVIPHALEGKDILASAPTGTGKTLAFLLPVVQYLLDFPRYKKECSRVLILTPTRELALQIEEETLSLIRSTNLTAAALTGGISMEMDLERLESVPDILIATTGRLLHHIRAGHLQCHFMESLVIDEADRMLDMGFINDVLEIAEEMLERKQTMLFSATLEGNGLNVFVENLLTDPIRIDAQSSRKERKKINQFYYRADNFEHKKQLLIALLQKEDVQKSIIFVKKRERVHEVVGFLQQAGINSCYLEGEMPQDKRSQAISRLNNDQVSVLVATDVASRGLDINDITHVFNFDLPRSADVYLHRIGRTARAGKKGSAISIVEAHDYPLLEKLERYTKEPIKRRVVEGLKPTTKTPVFKKKNKKKVKDKDKSKTKGKR